jgi:hypothetical protein
MRSLKPRAQLSALLLAATAAALAPLIEHSNGAAVASAPFPGWPAEYEGRALIELPLTQRETTFVQDFPGRVGRFTDGSREIIIRWVGAPTRKLHSAADCFRGIGYGITPVAARKGSDGSTMGCFRATLRGASMTVCEVIRDERGGSWSDVSAWYWDGMLRASAPPSWSFVVAQPE